MSSELMNDAKAEEVKKPSDRIILRRSPEGVWSAKISMSVSGFLAHRELKNAIRTLKLEHSISLREMRRLTKETSNAS
jgi:hypothetical protein